MANVRWISHRGLREKYPENTAAAFQAACDAGFEVLETDLRTTRDGHIVLFHDPSLKRMLGREDQISSLTRSQLEALHYPSGEKILFLEEFVRLFTERQWTFDIKPDHADAMRAAFAQFLNRSHHVSDLFKRSRFLFWDGGTEDMWRRSWPDIQCYAREAECYRAALCLKLGMKNLAAIKAGTTYALVSKWCGIRFMSARFVQLYHERGAKVCAYLPETEEAARAALVAGVDEVITNHRIVI